MYREEEALKAASQNGFWDKLQERLPGLDLKEVRGWASAAVKHLAQYLDDRQRGELAKFLPPGLVPVVEEAERVVKLFGKERPGDFFVVVTGDAGAPPSEEGALETITTVIAALRERIPKPQVEDIEKGLPEEIAEIWRRPGVRH